METIHLPLISSTHYDAFRALFKGGLPDTYDEWNNLHMQHITDCIRQGLAYDEISIILEEFVAYCRASGSLPKPIVLRRFAREKALKKT